MSNEEVYKHPTCLPMNVAGCEEKENGYRTHHYKLGSKVSELCTRIRGLEFELEFLKSLIPEEILCKAKKRFVRMLNQKAIVLEESKKLKELRRNLAYVGVMHTY